VGELAGFSDEPDLTLVHDHDDVGKSQRVTDVLLDQQDGRPVAPDLLERVEQLSDEARREPERQLVHHKQLRLRDDRAREREHLLLSTGKRSGDLLAALLQDREEVVDARERAVQTVGRVRGHHQVFLDRQSGEDAAPFRDMRQPQPGDLMIVLSVDANAVEGDLARRRRHHPRHRT